MHQALSKLYHLFFPSRPGQLDFLTSLAAPPARMLDVACGTAEYAAALAGRGYEAWAVELDPHMLNQAKHRHPQLAASGKLVLGDMRELTQLVTGQFDLVFCIGNSLPQLASLDEVRQVLTQMLTLAGTSGAAAVQVVNYDRVLKHLAAAECLQMPALAGLGPEDMPVELLRWNEPGRDTDPPGTMRFRTKITLGQEQFESTSSLLALTRERLAQCFPPGTRAEWYGGFDRAPWTPESPATVVVLRPGFSGV